MNKKEFIFLLATVVILLAVAIFCLFVDSVFKDAAVAHATTSELYNSINNKIISGEMPLTDDQIIKLFSNEADESKSIQELIVSFREMLEALAYLIITLALLQGYTIINGWRKRNG